MLESSLEGQQRIRIKIQQVFAINSNKKLMKWKKVLQKTKVTENDS